MGQRQKGGLKQNNKSLIHFLCNKTILFTKIYKGEIFRERKMFTKGFLNIKVDTLHAFNPYRN